MVSRIITILLVAGVAFGQKVDWVSDIKNAPANDARTFDFKRLTPRTITNSTSLVSGTNTTVTLVPCPRGVAIGNVIKLTGGGAGDELVTVSLFADVGSGCTATFTPTSSRITGWSASSATGGLQEAICALPASGGEVTISADITLLANVNACGREDVFITKNAGAMIGGGQTYTVLGQKPHMAGIHIPVDLNSPTKRTEYFSTNGIIPNPWPHQAWSGHKTHGYYFKVGATLPDGMQGPNTFDTVTATMDIPLGVSDGAPSTWLAGQALSGVVVTHDNRVGAVGVFGSGFCDGSSTISVGPSCWGANFMGGTIGAGDNTGASIFGEESDINIGNWDVGNAAAHFAGGGACSRWARRIPRRHSGITRWVRKQLGR